MTAKKVQINCTLYNIRNHYEMFLLLIPVASSLDKQQSVTIF